MMRLLLGVTGLIAGLALLIPGVCHAQLQYVPSDESRVWIEGTSTVNDFTCSTKQIEGHARLSLEEQKQPPPSEPQAALDTSGSQYSLPSTAPESPIVQARVPVRALDCGKRRQNEDLYEAMKASEHPAIRYEIVNAEVVAAPDTSRDHYVVEAIGNLTIAGETRTVRLTLDGRRLDDGRIHARGSLPMQMTDFNVDPPTAMLGLIRVRDSVTVHFDITAAPAGPGTGSSPSSNAGSR